MIMGSGGTHCDACRKRNDQCVCLPERVEYKHPCCPWCGEIYQDLSSLAYRTIVCQCGHNFEAERMYISRALGNRT